MNKSLAIAIVATAASLAGCHSPQADSHARATKQEIADLRAAYAAFNRGDIDAAVKPFDPGIEWIEPAQFPGGGTYRGVEGAKRYLKQSRAGADEVISEPEQFIFTGNRIVVFVHARVRPKGSNTWQEIRLADVYTFRNGKACRCVPSMIGRKHFSGPARQSTENVCSLDSADFPLLRELSATRTFLPSLRPGCSETSGTAGDPTATASTDLLIGALRSWHF